MQGISVAVRTTLKAKYVCGLYRDINKRSCQHVTNRKKQILIK